MIDPTMDLQSLKKTPDADVVREMIGFAAERFMEMEVGARMPTSHASWAWNTSP